jgi:hypothetical protein
LIVSEGILAVELCQPIVFADRIRQGYELFFAHAPIRLSTFFFNYVQPASEGTLKWIQHISLREKNRRKRRGATGLPRRGLFQAIVLPVSWFLNLGPKSDLIAYRGRVKRLDCRA